MTKSVSRRFEEEGMKSSFSRGSISMALSFVIICKDTPCGFM